MEHIPNDQAFPQQNEPAKHHGTHDENAGKEKYIRDSGNIEDIPSGISETPKMNAAENEDESSYLTDQSGEEKREDYINTDERKNDLNRKGR